MIRPAAVAMFLLGLPAPGQEGKPPEPSPAVEPTVTGSVEVGYRAITGVAGSFNTYRSVVNLGEGPKLFQLDLQLLDPSRKLFDRATLSASNWGGDPYNTFQFMAERKGLYRLSADYRNIAYYNFLPSFADPGAGSGTFVNERSFDIQRRNADIQLELFPTRRVTPYLAYTHDSGFGSGITPFETDGNEYPVATRYRDQTNNYRGGVRLDFNRAHLTVEQGGTTFKDDQRVFTSEPSFGDRTTPLLGQRLLLSSLNQAYGVRGDSIYSKALFTAGIGRLNLYGQFLYSRPSSDVQYSQNNTGLFVALGALQFYTGQQDTLSGTAQMPHSSGAFGFELPVTKRVRVVESWTTDRFHNASNALLRQALLLSPGSVSVNTASPADQLEYNYSRQQVDLFIDPIPQLTLRAGYRYVWGDALVRSPSLRPTPPLESGELSQHVFLTGATIRPRPKWLINYDLEAASSDRAYFRTSLQDYVKLRARARYQLRPSLVAGANINVLSNENNTGALSSFSYLSRMTTAWAQWNPGKRVSLLSEYTRSTLRSDIVYLDPGDLSRQRSLYRDNGHMATSSVDVTMPGTRPVKLTFGGSLFISNGSRPTRYYQPLGRLQASIFKRVDGFFEWRYYGFSELFYLYEGFRSHHLVTGLRFTL